MPDADAAIDSLRDLVFAAQSFRVAVADHYGVGLREAEATAHLCTRSAMSAGELANVLQLTAGTVTNLLIRLERADLAFRANHPDDQRRVIVRPTERGRAMIAEIRGWLRHCIDAAPDTDAAVAAFDAVAQQLRVKRDDLRSMPADQGGDRNVRNPPDRRSGSP